MRWLAGFLPAFVVVIGGACGGDSEPSTAPSTTSTLDARAAERAALLAYEEALEPIAFEGGRVVVETLRPGITDVREQRFEDDVLAGLYERSSQQLRAFADQLAALDVPSFLAGAHASFEEGMEGYLAASEALRRAATAAGDEREALVQEAIDAGEAADDVWDEGRAALDEHRQRLGIDAPSPLG